ncbi:MAG: hypothetical protein ACLP19_23960 [Xanthobacteraceae bacterium]
MAQEATTHVKRLIAARERMIEDRRSLADALANEYKGGHTERMRDSFITAQNAIEAIDRAIAHETLIAREKPGSTLAPILFGPSGPERFER